MKKYAVVVLCFFMLFFVIFSPRDSGMTKTEKRDAEASSQRSNIPEGSVFHGHTATVKPGYKFARQGDGVAVINTRTGAFTGTYKCPCRGSNPNGMCDLVFSPTYITCKGGSCSGTTACLLVPSILLMHP